MKTKLLKRLKSRIRKYITGTDDFVLTPQTYDAANAKYVKDESRLTIIRRKEPLAPQLWKELDIKSNWFMRYWKHSRWRSRVEVIAAARGISEKEALLEVLEEKRALDKAISDKQTIIPRLYRMMPTLIPNEVVGQPAPCDKPTGISEIFGK